MTTLLRRDPHLQRRYCLRIPLAIKTICPSTVFSIRLSSLPSPILRNRPLPPLRRTSHPANPSPTTTSLLVTSSTAHLILRLGGSTAVLFRYLQNYSPPTPPMHWVWTSSATQTPSTPTSSHPKVLYGMMMHAVTPTTSPQTPNASNLLLVLTLFGGNFARGSPGMSAPAKHASLWPTMAQLVTYAGSGDTYKPQGPPSVCQIV